MRLPARHRILRSCNPIHRPQLPHTRTIEEADELAGEFEHVGHGQVADVGVVHAESLDVLGQAPQTGCDVRVGQHHSLRQARAAAKMARSYRGTQREVSDQSVQAKPASKI